MALTKSDFEKYRVNEVLARCEDDDLMAWPFRSVCVDERKQLQEDSDETGISLFTLLINVSSFELEPHNMDPDAPFMIMKSVDGQHHELTEFLGTADLDFLAAVVRDVAEPIMRAQIADVLWVCRHGGKNRYKIACLACDSYLESIDQGSLSLWVENRLERALQIAMLLNEHARLHKGLAIAQEIADTKLAAGEVATWSRMMEILAKSSESDRDKFAEQIWQQASVVENEGKCDFAARLKEDALNLFRANKQTIRVAQARLNLVKTLVACAEKDANSGNGWIPYVKAQTQIEQAISHHKKASGTKERLEELNELLDYYGKKVYENMDWKEMTVELPQDNQDELNAMADRITESFRGKPFDEDLLSLAAGLQPINFDAVREEADRSAGGLASLFDSREINHAGKTVGRGETITVGWCAANHRLVHAFSMIRPAIIQIEDDHDVQLEDIAKLLEQSDFVPPHSRRTFARGLLAGFKFDLVTAAHILPPMLENAFREMLASMDKNTARWDSEFISKERSLAWALEQPELEQILGADLLFDLKTLLLDEEGGFNLRNKVSHGLMGDVGFFRDAEGRNDRELAQVIYLWWLALRLCFIIKRTERTE